MAKRKFALPGIHELSKEQEAVRALPKEGQHLIVGGPGTGKSVVALIRAHRHHRDRDRYEFLVYNHLLHRASGQLADFDLSARTWWKWFHDTFTTITGQSVPELSRWEIDWETVEEIIQNLPQAEEQQKRPFLVIDEGQDMPPQFYRALVGIGFDRFFVVADQNQQIGESNSSRQDIEDCLAIDTHDVIELRQNYRNHYRVARLAEAFYTGDPAIPPPELPTQASGTAPTLYRYDSLTKVVRGILILADRDPRHMIGVIAPNNGVRKRYLDALRTVEVQLDNARPRVETHYGTYRPDIAFDEGGILVINTQACKGLEFDIVVLADIGEHLLRREDPDFAKRRFYVMVARARELLLMFMKRNGRNDIQDILPTNPDVLRRKEI